MLSREDWPLGWLGGLPWDEAGGVEWAGCCHEKTGDDVETECKWTGQGVVGIVVQPTGAPPGYMRIPT